METRGRRVVAWALLLCCVAVSVAYNGWDTQSGADHTGESDDVLWQLDNAEVGPVSLIAEEVGVCSGNSCGLCNQPCADVCCSASEGKPECCSQKETPKFKIPFMTPRIIPDTPCPACNLCKNIMSQSYVDPKMAECCNAKPCGSQKMISNKIPDPPKDQVVEGVNPYGANWTYEKHVKKNGVNTTAFKTAGPIVKAAVAMAAKQAQEVASEMSFTPEMLSKNATNASKMNTSFVPGIPVLLMPPGVNVSDWEMPNRMIVPGANETIVNPNSTNSSNSSNSSNSTVEPSSSRILLGMYESIDEVLAIGEAQSADLTLGSADHDILEAFTQDYV